MKHVEVERSLIKNKLDKNIMELRTKIKDMKINLQYS